MQRADCIDTGVKPGNYAVTIVNGVRRLRHVMALEAAQGPRPSPLHQARHLCGNSACINPEHLAWGTQSDNELDKRMHGTDARGERNGNAKLSHELIDRIRSMKGTQRQIAAAVGVNQSTVCRALTGRTWEA